MSITETTISPRTYIVWRKEIAIADISNREMWDSAFGKVNAYIQQNTIQCVGPGAALYFTWDEPKGMTDFAIGLPVAGVTEVSDPELSVVQIPESKASVMEVRGGFEQLMDRHMEMVEYTKKQGIDSTITIEEYAVMGMQKPDPKDWVTVLYYLHT